MKTVELSVKANAELVRNLEEALKMAKAGEIVAGAAVFIASNDSLPSPQWNVIQTMREAWFVVGIMTAELQVICKEINEDEDR